MTTATIKEIRLTNEGTDPKTDRRTFSGQIKFGLSGNLGEVQVDALFYDVQSLDHAAVAALKELQSFLKSAQRAVDDAAAEYGYTR